MKKTNRVIIHGDMDMFFAAAEQLRHNLFGVPVVVGSPPNQRGVVSTASYEARKFGVKSAMPSRKAYELCPHAVFLPPDMDYYLHISEQIIKIFYQFTPLVEQVSVDEAFLDVSGSLINFENSVDKLANKLKQEVKEKTGLTISLGVASNKFLAKIASDLGKPDGLFFMPENPDDIKIFLAKLPVELIFGVGKVTKEILNKNGFRKIIDIQNCDKSWLIRLLGKNLAERLYALAFGEDFREIETEYKEKSISNEITFLEDCNDFNAVWFDLKGLIEKVAYRLRNLKKLAKVIRIKVRYQDFTSFTRQVSLLDYSNLTSDFLKKGKELFGKIKIEQPIRLIGFGVSELCEDEDFQRDITLFTDEFSAQNSTEHALDLAIDEIYEKIGKNFLSRGISKKKK